MNNLNRPLKQYDPFYFSQELKAYKNQLDIVQKESEERKAGFLSKAWQTALNPLTSIYEGVAKGFEGIGDVVRTGMALLEDDIEEKENLQRFIAYNSTKESDIVKTFDKWTKDSWMKNSWVDSAFTSVGQMLPSIAIGLVPGGQPASMASFVTSAAGSGTEKALNEGATLEQASLYGALSGTAEGVIEWASGGIGGLGSGWIAKLMPKTALKVGTKLATKPIAKLAMSMIGEGLEEVAGDIIDPYLQRIYKSEENIEPATFESMLQSFTIGALASGILQGSSIALQGRKSFQANLITEQINNINDKIVKETNDGTITKEKAEIYKQQQEALIDQLGEVIGVELNLVDNQEVKETTKEMPVEQKEQVVEQTPVKTETSEQVNVNEKENQQRVEGLEKQDTYEVVQGKEYQPTYQNENGTFDTPVTENTFAYDLNATPFELVKQTITTKNGKQKTMYNLRVKESQALLYNEPTTIKVLEKQIKQWQTDGMINEIAKNITQREAKRQETSQVPKQETPSTQVEQVINKETINNQQQTNQTDTHPSPPSDKIKMSPNQGVPNAPDTTTKVMSDMPKEKVSIKKTKNWIKRFVTNSMNDIEVFFQEKKIKNGEALSNQARTGTSKAGSMLVNGILDVKIVDGKVIINQTAKSLIDLFKFTQNKPNGYKQSFFDYLLHRHNVSRMDIPFIVEMDVNQETIIDTAYKEGEIPKSLYDMLTSKKEIKASDIRTELMKSSGFNQITFDTIIDLLGDQKPVFGEDITSEMSKKRVAEYEAKYPEFKDRAKDIYTYNKALLEQQVKAGLVSKDSADYFNRTYPDYVPTHRYSKGTGSTGLQNGAVQTGIKQAIGSDLVILPIDEQIWRQTQLVSRNIAINPLLQELGNNASVDGEVQLAGKKRITNINQIDFNNKTEQNLFSYLEVKKDGSIERVSINVSNGIADGLRSLNPNYSSEAFNKFTSALRKPNNLFKKITTSLNPFFSFVRNPIRDIQNAFLFTKYGIKNFSKNYGVAIKEIRTNGKYWQAYQASGGTYSSIYNFQEANMKTNPTTKFGKLMTKIENASNFIEQLPRLSEFISSIEANNTIEQAILDSAEVTVNFGRAGIGTKWANSTLLPFFNAKMQGALKPIRMVLNGGSVKALIPFFFKAMLLGIAPSVLNNIIYDDDEDYQDLRVEDKTRYYLFKVGSNFVKLPKAELFTAFSSTYFRINEARKGEEFDWGDYLSDLNSGLSPVESLRTIFSPINDIINNRTWYGSEIEGQKFNNVRPRERYDETTSWIAKTMGKTLNYSPKKIHYLIDQYSGIIGDIILPITTKKYAGNYLKIVEQNFALDPTSSNKYSNLFYKKLEDENYNKTNGDMVAYGKVRYLNKVRDSLSKLYQEQRDINNSDISASDKKAQTKAIQILINNLQKAAMKNVNSFGDLLSNYELTEYSFDNDYREATRLFFGAETALKNYNAKIYAKAQDLFAKGIDYDIYYSVYFDTKEMDGDYDFNGNYIKGSKQAQIWNYINKLNIAKSKKELLYSALGYSIPKAQSNTKKDTGIFKTYK